MVLAQAGRFATELGDLLQRRHSDKRFVIIVAVSDSCIVRFHMLRVGESWVAPDLETYENEAVMVVRVPFSASA